MPELCTGLPISGDRTPCATAAWSWNATSRLLYLIFVRLGGQPVLLGLPSATKDIEPPVL
ncbi:hypothetical protein [Saccharothrix algeriensis]|uniref:Uncharacterized protein n=1 Tax=Saccharothrix algeriensis TaxID=173560 RepID=A0ABS2SDU6_9PSEU|nr:hypothetical protein [Saccharothrix algeriensis]MBM7814437.1 hypothetical protein [Saccharothrix algeriensis]